MRLPLVALVLLAAAFVALYPQSQLHEWIGTEGRRVQIALEMLESGDWRVPLLFGEPTLAKPPLHYWILAGSERLFGLGWLSMRLPSILAVWLLSVLAYGLHRRAFGAAAAWIAALGILCSPIVVSQFPTAEIDPIFACLTAGSLWLLAFGVARTSAAALLCAGLVGGLALLHKGPPYFLFAAGAWLVWLRHRRMRGIWVYLAGLLAPPGLFALSLVGIELPAADVAAAANVEVVDRFFGHRLEDFLEIPGFLLRALLIQAPLVFWCFWEHRSVRDARMGPEDLTLRMCSGAAVLAVVLLACFPAKPTRYLLPNVPLFTFAVAPAVAHYAQKASRLGRLALGVVRTVGVVGAIGLLALPWLPAPLPWRAGVLFLAAALAPMVVRTPRGLVAMFLALPVIGAWTGLADYRDAYPKSPRAVSPHVPLFLDELKRVGAPAAELEGFGHLRGGLLLEAGILPKGQETPHRPPQSRWLLMEGGPLPPRPGYVERLRLCLPRETFVLEEQKAGR